MCVLLSSSLDWMEEYQRANWVFLVPAIMPPASQHLSAIKSILHRVLGSCCWYWGRPRTCRIIEFLNDHLPFYFKLWPCVGPASRFYKLLAGVPDDRKAFIYHLPTWRMYNVGNKQVEKKKETIKWREKKKVVTQVCPPISDRVGRKRIERENSARAANL